MKQSRQFGRQITFLCEIDKVKSILRRTMLMDGSRRENDAEHAWHLAVMAMVFSGIAKERSIDLLKVIRMALIHDIVEIDSGDAFLYDEQERLRRKGLEAAAAKRIFGLLPRGQAKEFRQLWEEFEARTTAEACFAAALDRFQPILHNFMTKGRVWRSGRVTAEQVLSKNRHIADGSPLLWEYVQEMVKEGVKQGFFK